jgi:uncharacterized protein
MFLLDDVVVYTATDLAKAASCEFATLRALDVRLARIEAVSASDPVLERAAELGDLHEHRVLDAYRAELGVGVLGTGGGVVEISAAHRYDASTLVAKREETLAVLRGGADVVFQGSFFDGRFHGRSDFLVRRDDAYAVYDSKLARHAKITALLQLAAYADQLERGGIAVHPQVGLILGDGEESLHDVRDLLPVYRERRERLQAMLDEHHAEPGAVEWNDPRYSACGRCADCTAEVETHRDLLLVAGMRVSQRKALREAGVATIEDLASAAEPADGVAASTMQKLRAQARLQVAQDRRPKLANGQPDVRAEVCATAALEALPLPDPGDIFFDFEGDPLWAENGSPDWGLEYLFGVVEGDTERFVSFWAHDRAEEKQALVGFLAYVAARRAAYPGMHIYHYASYEKTALLRLAGRHGVGEEQIDDLLRAGVLVDLYSTVRQSILVSQPSYSIKKLEPLYMGDELRAGDVTDAAASVVEYAHACALREAGKDVDYAAALDSIGDYNHYDCLSTLRLRDWLLVRAADAGVTWPAPASPTADIVADADDTEAEPDPVELELRELAGERPRGDRSADEQAYAMLGAALGYHRREVKPFWWAHFDRLAQPVDVWSGARDVFLVESAEVVTDWVVSGRQRSARRSLALTGEWGTGTTAGAGEVFVVHADPVPAGLDVPEGAVRGAIAGIIESLEVDAYGRDVVRMYERLPEGVDAFPDLPLALTPGPPPHTASLEAALRHLGETALMEGLVPQPGLEVLRRALPRLTTGALPTVGTGEDATVDAITAAVSALDDSYLAVQGPPGTGKTYLGARVVRNLVARGWRIGVVAQSHAVVDHFLDAVVESGLPGDRVGKKNPSKAPQAWTALQDTRYADFLAQHATDGCLLGGTAWDFTNLNRVARGSLDLLVIDEAGQFSLANTLAVSTAATRLMLLGDPQQLPQVSQGTHPEPVDHSALGWLMDGEPTLRPELGYFLERTWRMHPALCARISRLAYDDRLVSQEPVTTARHLGGLEPGLHVVRVDHVGNSVASIEEAREVVAQVRRLLGSTWHDPRAEVVDRPLVEGDVLVVAAYNAQVAVIRGELADAGLTGVRVGTVDRFQGQEAPVVIVSMAASSSDDVPRGMEFLLSRNRVNVAVSRGQWAALVIRSPHLTDHLPATPAGLADLGAFIGACTGG